MRGRPTLAAFAALVLSLHATSGSARAQGEDVDARDEAQIPVSRALVIDPDPALLAALNDALAPWSVALETGGGPCPLGVSGAVRASRELAEAHEARVVVCVLVEDGRARLWAYDSALDRVLERALPSLPPFDEPTAAAIALTVKTLLRQSTLAPESERVGIVEAPRPLSPRQREWAVEISAGVLALHTDPADAEPRFGLALGWWPRALSGLLGVTVGARIGPGIGLSESGVEARWTGTWVTVGLRGRAYVDIVALGGGLDLGARISTFGSTERGSGDSTSAIGGALCVMAWGEAGVRLDPAVLIGLRLGAAIAAPTTTYEARGSATLSESALAVASELVLELAWE